jgi:hypothetical protein
MSWYKKDVEMTVRFQLKPQAVPLTKPDYDILLVKPDKTATYTNDGITVLTAPTATAQGVAEYTFTPDQDGRYLITLGYGTSSDFVELNYVELEVQTDGQPAISATIAAKRTSKDTRTLEAVSRATEAPSRPVEAPVYGGVTV